MKVKCKVTNPFNDLQDGNKQRRVGEEFKCTLERAEFLQKNNVVEIIEVAEKPTKETPEVITEEKPKRKRTKKTIENEK
jgi:hypothetical protein